MKVSLKKIEIILIVILYLGALFVWTLPIQRDGMPFGDVDSSSHFTIGDYMSTYDRSILEMPYPLTFRYLGQNERYPTYLWYPPQYWTNTGIAQTIGGERILPPFIMVAIFSTLIILSSFFLVRSLFGFWPAFLGGLLLIFSTRDFMIYLWGQWPQSLSFAFTPLVLYCFYQYTKSHSENKARPIYFYVMAFLLAAQFFFHPQGMLASIGAMMFFSLFLIIKNRKIPFSFKHVAIGAIITVSVLFLFAPLNIWEFFDQISQSSSAPRDGKTYQFDKLFKWYQGIKNDPGLPDFYFTYNRTHGSLDGGPLSWWTLPLLLIGLFTLVYRRKEKDFVLLSWLVSYYFLTRMVVFGMGGRDIRMFSYEAHVFYPIIGVGLMSLGSFVRNKSFKKFVKPILIILFVFLAISVNGESAYNVLKGMQNSIGRINPMQYDAAEWIRLNLPEEADVYDVGTFGYQNYATKIKWMMALSQRHFVINDYELNLTDYVMVDYSDALLLRNQDYVNVLQNFEQRFRNLTPIYNKNNIRVYKVDEVQN